jgi:hypothetical protein
MAKHNLADGKPTKIESATSATESAREFDLKQASG